MNNSEQINISRGVTMRFIVLGGIFIIGAIIIGYNLNIFASLPILYLGIVLFISKEGVTIDTGNSRIKPYFDFFFAKIGTWESLDGYSKVVLRLFQENQRLNYKSISTNVKTKTYDIFLLGEGKKRLVIKEFTDYKKGKEMLSELSNIFQLPMDDQYQTLVNKLADRRKKVK